ncbi:MAG: hypothetical protein AAGC70_11685 [Pseudomonadota bacterium]
MTFDQIEQILGPGRVDSISRMILHTAHSSDMSDDPDSHRLALQELVVVLLAVLVAREKPDQDRVTRLNSQAQRLADLVTTMQKIDQNLPEGPITQH